MENVSIAAIAGIVVIVVVVFVLLRRRIVRARGKISPKEWAVEGEVEAVPPEPEEPSPRPKSYPPTPSGIRENVQIGSPLIRVLQDVRVFRNLQIGRGRIEVVEGKTAGGAERTDETHPRWGRMRRRWGSIGPSAPGWGRPTTWPL
ncbi:MAG: hypothetical protein ACPLYD_04055 [Anaerolineae bacterium]|jgi:hypothetical protein